jgi:hypothetical protein
MTDNLEIAAILGHWRLGQAIDTHRGIGLLARQAAKHKRAQSCEACNGLQIHD